MSYTLETIEKFETTLLDEYGQMNRFCDYPHQFSGIGLYQAQTLYKKNVRFNFSFLLTADQNLSFQMGIYS